MVEIQQNVIQRLQFCKSGVCQHNCVKCAHTAASYIQQLPLYKQVAYMNYLRGLKR